MENLKLRRKNLIMFPLGTVGRDMVYALITNFLLSYILFTRGLNAAQLTAVTAIMERNLNVLVRIVIMVILLSDTL